jgi:chitinase
MQPFLGAKSYCCSEPPPDQFTDCAWYNNAKYPTFPDYLCDTACPEGSVKLAMQDADCVDGERAYCCKGKPPPKIEPPDNDDFGSNAAREFSALMTKWLNEPTCAGSLDVPPLGWPKDKTAVKRSLIEEAYEFDILNGRDTKDCTMDLWLKLLRYSTIIFTATSTGGIDPLARVWDLTISERYQGALSYAELSDWLKDHPLLDPRAILEWILNNILGAIQGLKRAKSAQTILCEYPTLGKRSNESSLKGLDVDRRMVDIYEDQNGDYPTWRVILQGINRYVVTTSS